MSLIDGIDVSHHQDPNRLDVAALRAAHEDRARVENNGAGFFVVARACYGTRPDRTFAAFAERTRAAGAIFSAYLFYRQTETWEAQADAFSRQLSIVGGLRHGEMFPVLDIETNERFDGPFNAAKASADCQQIAERWKDEFGGVVLYYSALQMPALLNRPAWMLFEGMWHWPADYGSPAGDPRVQPPWHVHQYGQGATPVYKGADVDVNVFNPEFDARDLLIRGEADIDPEAQAVEWRMAAGELRHEASRLNREADRWDAMADDLVGG